MPVLVVAVLLAAAGCGVRPSGVIQGGPGPTGVLSGVELYLVSRGELTTVLREVPEVPAVSGGSAVSATESLALLVAGPSPRESELGLTSELPPDVRLLAVSQDVDRVTVTLSVDVAELSTLAADQLVCTAAAASVTLVGMGHTREARTCPLW